MSGHCMKCKDQREITAPQNIKMKNGTPAVRGNCSVCGTAMFRIVGKAN